MRLGYEWAAENEVTDPNDCGGSSQSFIEGCQAFAVENYSSPIEDTSGSESGDENQDDEGQNGASEDDSG
jgi:hypothetical protein